MWGHSVSSMTFHWLIWGARYSASMLCIACALLALWASAFDHGVPVNTIRHARLLSGYFGSVAVGLLIVNLAPGSAVVVGAFMTGASVAFYVLWATVLDAKGQVPIERLIAPQRCASKPLPWVIRRFMPY